MPNIKDIFNFDDPKIKQELVDALVQQYTQKPSVMENIGAALQDISRVGLATSRPFSNIPQANALATLHEQSGAQKNKALMDLFQMVQKDKEAASEESKIKAETGLKEAQAALSKAQLKRLEQPETLSELDKLKLKQSTADIEKTRAETEKLRKEVEMPKGEKLVATELKDLANFDSVLSRIQGVREQLPSVETGKTKALKEGAKEWIYSTTGIESLKPDQAFIQIKADLSKLMSEEMSRLSGAAVSEQERKRLEKFLPKEDDSKATLQSKLNQFEKDINRLKNSYVNTLKKTGRNVGQLETAEKQPEQPQTKVIKGVTYKKVTGGWEEI